MKFLILTRYDPFKSYSGTEIFAKNLATALRNLDHQLSIAYGSSKARSKTKRYEERSIQLFEIQTIDFPFLSSFEYFVKTKRLVRELLRCKRFDAVIAIGAGQGFIFQSLKDIPNHPLLVYFAADCMRREAVYVMHMLRMKKSSIAKRLMTGLRYMFLIRNDQASCQNAELILTSSKDTKRCLSLCYGVPSEKAVPSYEGISDDFSQGFEVTEPVAPTLLHIATSHERKGTFFLFMALKTMKDKYGKDVKVNIAGPIDPYYLRLAEDLSINVSFIGQPEDLRPLYASCTAAIIPSVSEGFCLPVIEAAMFGKPSIVSNVGSLPELVDDGIDGYIVPVANVHSLAKKIHELVTNDDSRRSMGKQAKEKAENFKISLVAQRITEIIKKRLNA